MTSEACFAATEVGVVSTRDVRDLSSDEADVVVLVLRLGAPALRERIVFGEIPGGRGVHRGLVCPTCKRPHYKLFASSSGLGCRSCTRRRTRRQREHRRGAWRHLGGELEDFVLRGLRPGRRSTGVPDTIANAAQTLMAEDRERATVLLTRAANAVRVAVVAKVNAESILGQEEES